MVLVMVAVAVKVVAMDDLATAMVLCLSHYVPVARVMDSGLTDVLVVSLLVSLMVCLLLLFLADVLVCLVCLVVFFLGLYQLQLEFLVWKLPLVQY